jgi:uncharacterized protein YeaO (DUF488 family)
MNVEVKRVYEPVARGDGLRVLVDRIRTRKATFLYATKAERHNHAQLLRAHLETL